MLKRIVDSAAAPGTEISVNGLSPHRAIAEQYRYLEFLEPPKSDQRGEAGAVGVRNVRLTRRILTVSATCGISETKIVDQQIRYSLRSPKRRSLILDTNRGLPGISSPDRAARFAERKLYRICWQTIFVSEIRQVADTVRILLVSRTFLTPTAPASPLPSGYGIERNQLGVLS